MQLTVFARFIVVVIYWVSFLLHFNALEAAAECDFPLIEGTFYNDSDSKEVFFSRLNSLDNLNEEKSFPHQYVMLTCSAPYPVEWETDLPRRYFYSYLLDDEVRSSYDHSKSALNGTSNYVHQQSSSPSAHPIEKFIVRLQIGNETLAKMDFSLLKAICKPVHEKDVSLAAAKANKSCGETVFWLRRYEDEKNTTKILVKFQNESTTPSFLEENAQVNNRKEVCVKDEKWQENKNYSSKSISFQKSSRDTFICRADISDEINATLPSNHVSLSQLHFNQANLHSSFGTLQCTLNGNGTDGESFHVPYYFTPPAFCGNLSSLFSRSLYLRRSSHNTCSAKALVNEDELLSLCVRNSFPNAKDIYIGDNVTVTCLSSNYYFAGGMQIQLIGADGSLFSGLKKNTSTADKEHENALGGYRNISQKFLINSDKINGISCVVPLKRSRRWKTQLTKIEVKVPVKISFDQTETSDTPKVEDSITFFMCNATGSPLPTLVWSRINNEKIPTNVSTEIHSFLLSPSSSSSSSVLNSTWISSKLFIPTKGILEKELVQYYGRYICTAKNRFESIEKIFLYDDSTDPSVNAGQNALLKSMGKSPWFWLGIGLAILVLAGFVIILGIKLRAQARTFRLFTKAEIDDFMFGKPELLLADSDNYEEINSYAAYLPYDRNQFEIFKEQLDFNPKDILGTGAYGTVYKGIFKDNHGQVEPVAIKTVNSSSDKMYFAALLSEIKIMGYMGRHENLIRFVGACTKYLDQRQIFVATEYCENGDMLSFIQKHRDVIIHNARSGQGLKLPLEDSRYCQLAFERLLLSPHLLLIWAHQVAKGMSFLSEKKVIHGDVAARNLLLGADLTPKIGDFGLAKQLQKYSNYVQKGDDLVPWRWLAVESLQFMKFSIKSDVWAFGVTLYEILSLGQVPFANYTYSELFIVALCQGERPPRPLFACEKMYELMLNCWQYSSHDRPTFQSLETSLKTLMLEKDDGSFADLVKFIPTPQDSIRYVAAAKFNQQFNPCLYIDNSNPNTAVLRFTKPESAMANNMSPAFTPIGLPTPSYIDWSSIK